MSDANKLSLARAIHGTPHATRDSFSPSTWAGVERAWAWVEKHYQPKEPTVKQENEPMSHDAALARVAELEKRGAVDVEACAREIVKGDKTYALDSGMVADVAAIIRKHTRDVRRITREEARLVYQLLPRTTWDGLLKALRAIGFEVEA